MHSIRKELDDELYVYTAVHAELGWDGNGRGAKVTATVSGRISHRIYSHL